MPLDPGGPCMFLALRPMHYSLRPMRENRLPLDIITGLNKLHAHGITALHYGSCAPLSTLRLQPHDCNPKTRYQLLAELYWVADLHRNYTMYAELAHPILIFLKYLIYLELS